jgi:pyrimidine oxygenase
MADGTACPQVFAFETGWHVFCSSVFGFRSFTSAEWLAMQLGVFIPIGNNGWLISTTSPQYMPTFDLNRAIVEKAERFGFEFALSMIKLHGFGGPSQYWDHNLESFTLMAGLAAVTSRIQLFASVAVLTMPPPLTARMAVTIDSISHGRFGVNIVSGWQRAEYTQMGIWPGPEHYKRRYEYCAEYVTIMRELWATGRSNLKGNFFQMHDCRVSPLPQAPVKIIGAAQSDNGTKFAAEYCDYNFCASYGINEPTRFAPSVARLVEASRKTGRDVGALILMMIIADETDEAAIAKWEHYKAGTDLEAIAWRDSQAQDDPSKDPFAQPNRYKLSAALPTNQGVLIGSYASVARMLDQVAEVPGVRGVLLTFDDFVIGMEQFGTRIQPLMASRSMIGKAA